jgi:ATP/maltotriose-dependent transcriptional regulator MalT
MEAYADLELSLRRWGGDDYAVEARFRLAASAGEAQLISGSPPRVRIDFDALLEHGLNPTAYGTALSQMLFADARVAEAFARARAQAETAGVPLRLRLRLAADDELHSLRWETLQAPDGTGPLARSERILLSRHLDSADMTPLSRGVRADLRALLVVAGPDPETLESYRLAPVDVPAEIARAKAALGTTPTTLISSGTGAGATLDAIVAGLRDGPEIVCLVAHGTLRRGRSYLWLDDERGGAERVEGTELVEAIARLPRRPLLLVLISCQSAGTSSGDGALAALGPQLATAGVAAVLAMQANLKMESAAKLLPTFFNELWRDGQVDRALAAARLALRSAEDWWQPALFLRVPDGRIWLEDAPAQPALVAGPAIPPPPQPERPPDLEGFVGRVAELAAFGATLEQRGSLLLTGMPGAGKTSMAAALARNHGDPQRTFWHSFRSGEGVETLIWALAGFLAHTGQPGLWELLQTARIGGGQPPPSKVLIDYLINMFEHGTYLICLDDMHLIDTDPQIEPLIMRLRPLLRTTKLRLIITSWRVPDFAAIEQIEIVTGLSLPDVQLLLATRNVHLDAPLLEALYNQVGGNAQLVTLAADALRLSSNPARLINALTEADSIERYLLNTIDDVLSADERTIMKPIAALLEPGGTRSAIETVADGVSVRRSLRELSDRHLLLTQESAVGKEYRQHGIVQRFYYEELTRRERLALHQRAAAYYERDERDPLRAALHHTNADDTHRALEIVLEVREQLINGGQATQLLALLKQIDPARLDTDRRIQLLMLRAELATILRARVQAEADFMALFDLPTDLISPSMRARACRGMGQLLELEDPQAALTWLQRGLDLLNGSDPLETALLERRVGSALLSLGDPREAQLTLERSLALLPAEAGEARADVFLNLGVARCMQGDLQAGGEHFAVALTEYMRIGQIWAAVTVQQNLARVREITGEWAAAAADYRAALEQATHLGLLVRRVELMLNLANLLGRQGDFAAAMPLLTESLALAEREQLRTSCLLIQSSWAVLLLAQGDLAATAAMLDSAEQLAAELQTADQLPEIYRTRALLRLEQADPQAVQIAEQAVEAAQASADPLAEGSSRRVLGQTLLAVGNISAALEQFTASSTLLADDPYELACTQAALGQALIATEPEQAQQLLRAAQSTFAALGVTR